MYAQTHTHMHTYMYVYEGNPFSVVANKQDCDIIVSEFELQSFYYVHSQINTFGKGMNLLTLPAKVTTTLLLKR